MMVSVEKQTAVQQTTKTLSLMINQLHGLSMAPLACPPMTYHHQLVLFMDPKKSVVLTLTGAMSAAALPAPLQ
jgi:hypothetical protein